MFKLKPSPTFKLNASLTVPGEEPAILPLEVNYLNPEALGKWEEKYGGKPELDGLFEIIVGWDAGAVKDPDGRDVAYSKDALARLLKEYHRAGHQIMMAYMREVLGVRIKN